MNKNINESKFAAVDIGGTNTRFALFNNNGKIVLKAKFATNYNDVNETLDWILRYIDHNEINYLALCIPGPSDYKNGIVLKSPNLGKTWENFNLKEYLLKKSKSLKDIIFENDANAMAYANHKINNCKSEDVSQFFTISTGFGAGLIINGKIFGGRNNYAQEIAQIPLSKNGFSGESRLLNPYALELHCSGTGIETKAKYFGIADSAKEVFEKACEGNLDAINIVNEAKETLTRAFATFAGIIAPNYFFVGGSVALNAKEMVLEAFEEAKKISDPKHFEGVKLIFDQMGDDSALIGLYHLIKDKNSK